MSRNSRAFPIFRYFQDFALGFVFWGTQEALCSGTVDALLYDALKAEGNELAFERVATALALVLGGGLAGRMARLFAEKKLRAYRLWVITAGVVLITGTVSGLPVLLPLYFLFYGMMAAGEVIFHGHVQRTIGSAGRATVGTIVSFVFTLFGIGLTLGFGWLAEVFTITVIFPVGGAVVVVTGLLYRPDHPHSDAQPSPSSPLSKTVAITSRI